MSKFLYYDLSCGISGDMHLAALVGLGVDFKYLKSELSKLGLDDEFVLERKDVLKRGISSIKIDVLLTKKTAYYRNFKDIKRIILNSNLSEFCKDRSIKIFERIAVAEAKAHDTSVEKVHFHEVGAVDSIVDIVGACICLEYLGVTQIISSKVELGGGAVQCAHGVLSVPAPAVCEILKDVPVSIGRANFELTTPTGAAIVREFTKEFSKSLSFNIKAVGYGAGNKEAEFANILRIMLCESETTKNLKQKLIQTNIDDMDAESFAFACETLLQNGALDVFSHSVFMKKGRIGFELNVICKESDAEQIKSLIFKHTTSIGVREIEILKTELKREFVKISSKFGDINLKVSNINDSEFKAKPEFNECKSAAIKHNITLNEVKKEILKNYDKATKFKK
ncbi:nickel pincer cofactor biosynthesis protein LarC [Campylobacter sp. faydin G-105]|uniref:nickel pincer cofactor biosynthesis protein LarC n=1 Tax=Campylobacter anatolicus TaxID=2829105 RepID=UPI001B900916|nr:nickel pincer cofactor biosynthesis protein LarC [Campylobacter anatolicus]MBR8461865.1 nickel pincer cofactor biosynthesis protein LarC [Campylobacter anatolicus]